MDNRKLRKEDIADCPSNDLTSSCRGFSQVSDGGSGSEGKKERNDLQQIDRYDNQLDQESLMCQTIFPTEIWDHHIINAHLADDPKELETLINSSLYFRELLKEQRVLLLAKKVLPLLFKWICCGGKPRSFRSDLEYYSERYALKWREICKPWCSSFDQLVNEEVIDCQNISRRPYRLRNSVHFRAFMIHFERTHHLHPGEPAHRNPFIGRFLSFDFLQPSNQILPLLRTYGHHLLHLKMDLCQWSLISSSQFYLKFRRMLMSVPNLQSLSVNYIDLEPVRAAFIRQHPLPKLASLKILVVEKVPAHIFSELLRQNNHIASLSVDAVESFKDWDFSISTLELNNLRNLGIKGAPNNPPPIVKTWPVTKLHLNYYDGLAERWETIFARISNYWAYNNTLEDLTVLLPVARDKNESFLQINDTLNCRLNVPRLRVLTLMMEQPAFSIDFLVGMKLLERVKIYSMSSGIRYWEAGLAFDSYGELQNKQIVKWIGYEQRLYETNIWNVFERLKIVELDGKKYRREEWIKIIKRELELLNKEYFLM